MAKAKTYTLNNIKKAFGDAILTTNLYNFSVVKAPKSVKIDPSIFLRVKSSSVPKSETEILTVELQNHKFSGATKTSYYGEIQLTAMEGVNAEFLKMLKDLDETRNKRTKDDVTGFGTNINDQKADIRLVMVSSSGSPVRTYTMVGCIVKIDSAPDLNAEALAGAEVTFTITYDAFFEE